MKRVSQKKTEKKLSSTYRILKVPIHSFSLLDDPLEELQFCMIRWALSGWMMIAERIHPSVTGSTQLFLERKILRNSEKGKELLKEDQGKENKNIL